MLYTSQAGVAYHDVAATWDAPWWRTALTAAAVVGAVVVSAHLSPGQGAALTLLAVLAAVRWVEGRPLGGLASVAHGVRVSRAVWFGLAAAVAALGVLLGTFFLGLLYPVALEGGRGGAELSGVGLLALLAVDLISLWAMQVAGRLSSSPWPVIGVAGVVFTVLHGGGPIETVGALGLILAWLTLSTGGVEAAIAAHLAVTVADATLMAALGPATPRWADGEWQATGPLLVGGIGYGVAVKLLNRFAFDDESTPEPAGREMAAAA